MERQSSKTPDEWKSNNNKMKEILVALYGQVSAIFKNTPSANSGLQSDVDIDERLLDRFPDGYNPNIKKPK